MHAWDPLTQIVRSLCVITRARYSALYLDEWQDSTHTGNFNSILISKAFALIPSKDNMITLSFKQTFRFFAGTAVKVSLLA
jgi:hypothetical protein